MKKFHLLLLSVCLTAPAGAQEHFEVGKPNNDNYRYLDEYLGHMTEAQHKEMASFYEWIIKQYFTIVPPEQQWGICQWCTM